MDEVFVPHLHKVQPDRMIGLFVVKLAVGFGQFHTGRVK